MPRPRPWTGLLKTGAHAALAGALLGPALPAHAQGSAAEPELKAAIISNMLLFVEWPAKSGPSAEQLTVCYQGRSPVAEALTRLDGKVIKGKALKVVQLTPASAGDCHALYLSPENLAALDKTLALTAPSPVFITADSREYFQRGSMLTLELVGGRVVFDIDLRAAQKAGFVVSSKALRLARHVVE